jgi:hypothetical protein
MVVLDTDSGQQCDEGQKIPDNGTGPNEQGVKNAGSPLNVT